MDEENAKREYPYHCMVWWDDVATLKEALEKKRVGF